MKNFPHQFNDLAKLFSSLVIISQLHDEENPITDEVLGERLLRSGIYTYRNRTLTIDQYLAIERQKPEPNRGYLTAARDTRRFFELLGFIHLDRNRNPTLSTTAKEIIRTSDEVTRIMIWRDAMMSMGLEGFDGEISHPYRILLRIVNEFPGIQTQKLMLALEAENDSDEEMERIRNLIPLNLDRIIGETSTTPTMAANAVKILPSIAEQLNDITRVSSRAFPSNNYFISEDEISTEDGQDLQDEEYNLFRPTTSAEIAVIPIFNHTTIPRVDLTHAINVRQNRLEEHQEIVRKLAQFHEINNFDLFVGRFDCLAQRGENALLYEVKTILPSIYDQEKQTIKGVGQLKYYSFSIRNRDNNFEFIKEILVFSIKPIRRLLDFCFGENIEVIWQSDDHFEFYNRNLNTDEEYSV